MITLNQRLTTVQLSCSGKLSDIGSDHAYLPSMIQHGLITHAIAEVIKGPLKQRKECVR